MKVAIMLLSTWRTSHFGLQRVCLCPLWESMQCHSTSPRLKFSSNNWQVTFNYQYIWGSSHRLSSSHKHYSCLQDCKENAAVDTCLLSLEVNILIIWQGVNRFPSYKASVPVVMQQRNLGRVCPSRQQSLLVTALLLSDFYLFQNLLQF